jgi:hypothetical protein
LNPHRVTPTAEEDLAPLENDEEEISDNSRRIFGRGVVKRGMGQWHNPFNQSSGAMAEVLETLAAAL